MGCTLTIGLDAPLTLPCGVTLKNRLAKGAMTEGLATVQGVSTPELERLYGLWSAGGAAMLLTGNVQIDRDHLERPGNVIIDREPDAPALAALRRFAAAGTASDTQLWMQISHAGRQTQTKVNSHPKAPSAVKVALPGGQFGMPVALTEAEILDLIGRFALAARVAKETGFSGVQIHAAHGYLLSSFLSPRSNIRTDDWGGSLENRARMLMDVVKATRAAVGPAYPISVKLNSADFQKGGFAFEDSLMVARWLEAAGVDLIEISGGSYEQPAMMDMDGLEPKEDQKVAASTAAREAYFVDFAKAMKAELKVPLMVTGGFRSRAAMDHALGSGSADLIGFGRPLCADPFGPSRILAGEKSLKRHEDELVLFPPWLGWLRSTKLGKTIDSFAVQFWYYAQLYALGKNGRADQNLTVWQGWRAVEKRHAELLKERD